MNERGRSDNLVVPAKPPDRAPGGSLAEVVTGVPPEAASGARARPEYDPESRTLRQREMAKGARVPVPG